MLLLLLNSVLDKVPLSKSITSQSIHGMRRCFESCLSETRPYSIIYFLTTTCLLLYHIFSNFFLNFRKEKLLTNEKNLKLCQNLTRANPCDVYL